MSDRDTSRDVTGQEPCPECGAMSRHGANCSRWVRVARSDHHVAHKHLVHCPDEADVDAIWYVWVHSHPRGGEPHVHDVEMPVLDPVTGIEK